MVWACTPSHPVGRHPQPTHTPAGCTPPADVSRYFGITPYLHSLWDSEVGAVAVATSAIPVRSHLASPAVLYRCTHVVGPVYMTPGVACVRGAPVPPLASHGPPGNGGTTDLHPSSMHTNTIHCAQAAGQAAIPASTPTQHASRKPAHSTAPIPATSVPRARCSWPSPAG